MFEHGLFVSKIKEFLKWYILWKKSLETNFTNKQN